MVEWPRGLFSAVLGLMGVIGLREMVELVGLVKVAGVGRLAARFAHVRPQ
jgi:hypothetical protein